MPDERETLHGPVETHKICNESGLLATENCPEVVKNDYLRDEGIRINNGSQVKINFNGKINGSSKEISGVYIVDSGEPFQEMDSESGLPLTTLKDKIVYDKVPGEKCNIHEEKEELLDSIWDFLN